VLAFLRGADNTELESKLLALMPDDRTNRLVAGWLPAALNGDYEALLAAADVEALKIVTTEFQRLVGHSNVGNLLFKLRSNVSLEDVHRDSWAGSTIGLRQPTDFGVNRLPKGYQNQSLFIR
jgi:hypothetical protein